MYILQMKWLKIKQHPRGSRFAQSLLFSMARVFYYMIFPLMIHSALMEGAIDSLDIVNCTTKCGDVEIIYPFGIGDRCFLEGFEVICNKSIPYLSQSNLQLLEILPAGQVRVDSRSFMAVSCPEAGGVDADEVMIQLPENSPYTISVVSNKYMVVGCDTHGKVSDDSLVSRDCFSDCARTTNEVTSPCNGTGCCQASLPTVGKNLHILVDQKKPSTIPCGYGLIVENGMQIFNKSGLNVPGADTGISMRLGWGYWNCSNGAGKYVCGNNSECVASEDGYICSCKHGYKGNAYLSGSQGCQGQTSKSL